MRWSTDDRSTSAVRGSGGSLAALVIDSSATVGFGRIVDRVWADGEPPNDPRRTLRTYLARLRQALGDGESVLTVDEGWQLNRELVSVDAIRLDLLVDQASRPELDAHGRLAVLDDALALFQGRPYGDLADEDWVLPEAERLAELRAALVERRYQAMLDAGKHTDAVPGLAAEAEANPLRDRLIGLQMLALFRTGRQAEATRVFQQHRERLLDELGLEPGAELVDLDRRVVAGDPSLLLTESPGRALRGYRLGEQVGEGAFAMVYRGTQPTLGRDVAVKIIRSELANRPEFIRRFETEAYLVARLEHPHIVPLYDYWREPDRACLVLRYLRGGTLEAHLTRSGPLLIHEAVRFVDQIGAALTAAHRAGVVHRDVKPANVFLDESGNYYLGDFGIALEATELSDPTAALSAGSPAYASPEQLRREAIGPAADVHGLGISLYEALTARLPFPDAVSQADLLQRQLSDPIPPVVPGRSDLPPRVDDVLARATAKDPDLRFQSVDEFVAAVTEVMVGSAGDGRPALGAVRLGASTAVSGAGDRNPYKGLHAFTEADARDFRGRERLVDHLVDLLGRRDSSGRIAAVVGPSGIGKSSVVRAGLLPALRRGAVDGSDRWFVATMAPGSDPYGELAAALLRVASHTPADLMGLLSDDERGLARLVKVLIPEDADEEVLLVVDQFEELFTLVDDARVRRRFLDALAHAVTDARCPLRVVLTMRADFWDRPLRYGTFARLIERSTVSVTALAPDELERAIVEPALSAGCEFEPGLVSEIAADVADQPGALPLLQFALTELWERRVSGLLTRDAYRGLGGVAGALTRRAEELYDGSSADEQVETRRVFGRLVSPGDGNEDTRRKALRVEICTDAVADRVVGRYGQARLLTFDTDPATREPTIEVAHEALIREWPRLGDWLTDDREDLRLHRHLGTAAVEWDRDGRPESELYRGGRLEMAEDYAARAGAALSPIESAFLAAGLERRDAANESERQRLRRLRALLVGVVVVALLATVAGLVAFDQRQRARAVAADADVRRLANTAAVVVEEQRELGLLLAVEAHRRAPGPESAGALQQALIGVGPLLGTVGGGRPFRAAAWLDDQRLLGVGETGISILRIDDGIVTDLTDSPVHLRDNRNSSYDLQPLAVYASDGSTVAYVPGSDPTTVEWVSVDDGPSPPAVDLGSAPLEWLALSSHHLAALDELGKLSLVDRRTGAVDWTTTAVPEVVFADYQLPEGLVVLPTLPTQNVHTWAIPLVFDDDGRSLEVHGTVLRRYDTATGALTELYPGLAFAPDGPLFAPLPFQALPGDGDIVLTRSASFAQVFDRASGQYRSFARVEATANAAGGSVMEWVDWDGGAVATALLSDGRIIQFDVSDGTTVGPPIATGLADVHHIAVSPDGATVAASARSGVVLFALDGRRAATRALVNGDSYGSSISATGRFVVAGYPNLPTNDARRDRLIDLDTDREVELPVGSPRLWFPTGADVLIAEDQSIPSEIALVDPSRAALLGQFRLPSGLVDLAIHPEGDLVALSTWFDGAEVRSMNDGEVVASLDQVGDQAQSLAFSPDGSRLIALDRDGTPWVWETAGWSVVDASAVGDERLVAVRFTPDGGGLVTLDRRGRLTMRDPASGDVVRSFSTPATSTDPDGSLAFDSTGRLLLVRAGDSITLWDLQAGQRIGQTFPNDATAVAAVQDGHDTPRLVTVVDGTHLAWDLDTERWVETACRVAGRNLTRVEWADFGPADSTYRATCPDWPIAGVADDPTETEQ